MHRKPCRRKEHKPGPIMRTATSTSFSPPSFRHGRHQTPHFSRSTDERGGARIDFVSHGVRFRIHSRPSDRPTAEIRENPSVHPGGNRFRQIKEGGRGEGEEGGGIGMGAAYRAGAPPNKHPREFLRAFPHILVFGACPGKNYSSQNYHLRYIGANRAILLSF